MAVCMLPQFEVVIEVQPHSDDSQMHVSAPCSARVLGQSCPAFSSYQDSATMIVDHHDY